MEYARLSLCEEEVMGVIWDSVSESEFSYILDTANGRYGTDWKISTVSTYLNRIMKKGFLEQEKRGRNTLYRFRISANDYYKARMREYFQLFYKKDADHFLSDLASAKALDFHKNELPALSLAEEKLFSIVLRGDGVLKLSDIIRCYNIYSGATEPTVRTLLSRLAKKGYVVCYKRHGSFCYKAVVEKDAYIKERLYDTYHFFSRIETFSADKLLPEDLLTDEVAC